MRKTLEDMVNRLGIGDPQALFLCSSIRARIRLSSTVGGERRTPRNPFQRTTAPYSSRSLFSTTPPSSRSHHQRCPVPKAISWRRFVYGRPRNTVCPRRILWSWNIVDRKGVVPLIPHESHSSCRTYRQCCLLEVHPGGGEGSLFLIDWAPCIISIIPTQRPFGRRGQSSKNERLLYVGRFAPNPPDPGLRRAYIHTLPSPWLTRSR